ncbi:hypothetical protein JCM3766R1_000461 [Sporobolomyces carnicolor]
MAQHLQGQNPGSSTQAWEGDATLHSYCYDYMRKRGWNEAASRFAKDAGIKEEDWKGPPIEAPQGLLYEWWSVFWDVFIARSQKSGPRNPNADAYVEAMRAKRDPLVVQFNGPNAPPPLTLPRSLAHPPRPNSTNAPPHVRANYSQMHVLEQQELQNQMQQRGRIQQMVQGGARPSGMPQQPPTPGGSGPAYAPSPLPQQQQQPQLAPSGQPLPSGMAQPGMQPYPPGSSQGQIAQPRPPSSHSSPHIVPASHPYANGRPPQVGNGQPVQVGNALAQALAAVGLPGRDPDTLSPEEHAAVTAQMRRMGALPPSSQQIANRNGPPPPSQQAQQGRMVPQPPMRQDSQNRLNAAYAAAQDGRPQAPAGSQGPQGQLGQPQYMMHPVQQQQQNHMMAQQQRMMQVQQQGGPRPMMDPNGQGYPQAGSPASPAYSSAPSPYATPLVAHMQIPPAHPAAQGSPGQFGGPNPPPSRTGTSNKNRVVSQPVQQQQQQ